MVGWLCEEVKLALLGNSRVKFKIRESDARLSYLSACTSHIEPLMAGRLDL